MEEGQGELLFAKAVFLSNGLWKAANSNQQQPAASSTRN